jgi:hypothetical protein
MIFGVPLLAHAPPADTTPPSIGTPMVTPSSPAATDTVTVLVNVTDNRGVQNVTIVYTTDNWHSVNSTIVASYNVTTTTATGRIPALATGGHVVYYIIAFDTAGNRQVNNNSGAYFGFDVEAPPISNVTSTWIAVAAVAGVGLGVAVVSLKMIRKRPQTPHQSY